MMIPPPRPLRVSLVFTATLTLAACSSPDRASSGSNLSWSCREEARSSSDPLMNGCECNGMAPAVPAAERYFRFLRAP